MSLLWWKVQKGIINMQRLIKVYGKHDVVYAAKQRLIKLYKNNKYVYISFSGGKDSLAVVYLILELHESNEIDVTKSRVIFIDEEAIYPDVEEVVRMYRKIFLNIGARFYWLCLPIRHYNCLNMLYNDESMICWDPRKKDVWIRPIPKFAITNHDKFKPGDFYQEFMLRINDGPQVIGLRARESFQRLTAMSQMKQDKLNTSSRNFYYPIIDWTLNDVWLFMLDRKIKFPIVYTYMWKLNIPINRLRISQFFTIDSVQSLVRMMEFYPDLFEKIVLREPNAYLAMMYWDSAMFRRSSSTRKEKEGKSETLAELKDQVFKLLPKFKLINPKSSTYHEVKSFLFKYGDDMTKKGWETMRDQLTAGDPKGRIRRALYSHLSKGYKNKSGKLDFKGLRNE